MGEYLKEQYDLINFIDKRVLEKKERKMKKIIYWLSIIGPIASVLKTCCQAIEDVLKGQK